MAKNIKSRVEEIATERAAYSAGVKEGTVAAVAEAFHPHDNPTVENHVPSLPLEQRDTSIPPTEQPPTANGKAKAPPLSKRERFLKVVPKRVNNVINSLRRLANCSSKGGYEYTAAEAEKVSAAIQRAVDATVARFRGVKEASSFTL